MINGADVVAKIKPKAQLVKLYNRPVMRSIQDIEQYVQNRKRVLEFIALKTPERLVDVAISPSAVVGLERFWTLKQKHGVEVDNISLDVFTDGKWTSMVWIGKDSNVDFNAEVSQFIQQLKSLAPKPTPEMRAAGMNLFDPEKSMFALRYVRAKMIAKDALALQAESVIRLVDPTDDLMEAFVGKAPEVKVIDMPHVYVVQNFLEKKVYPRP